MASTTTGGGGYNWTSASVGFKKKSRIGSSPGSMPMPLGSLTTTNFGSFGKIDEAL